MFDQRETGFILREQTVMITIILVSNQKVLKMKEMHIAHWLSYEHFRH